jgi:hypothetical protein
MCVPALVQTTNQIKGDGAFEVSVAGESVIIGTPSIHSMWSAIGTVQRARAIAAGSGQFSHGRSHGWVDAYSDLHRSATQTKPGATNESQEGAQASFTQPSNENNFTATSRMAKPTNQRALDATGGSEDSIATSASPESVSTATDSAGKRDESSNGDGTRDGDVKPKTSASVTRSHATNAVISRRPLPDKLTLMAALRQIVGAATDPDSLTTRDVICGLEERFGANLVAGPNRPDGFSKAYLDEEILRVYGQLEPASLIIDQLYLGTEYNASNKEELSRYVHFG